MPSQIEPGAQSVPGVGGCQNPEVSAGARADLLPKYTPENLEEIKTKQKQNIGPGICIFKKPLKGLLWAQLGN